MLTDTHDPATLTTDQARAILTSHSIATRISRGRLKAETVYVVAGTGDTGSEWHDLTGWSRGALMAWLGY